MTQLISTVILSHFESFLTIDPGAASLMTPFLSCPDHRHSEGQSAVGSGSYTHAVWEETAKEVGQPTPKVFIVSVLCLQRLPFLCFQECVCIQTTHIAVD